MQLLKRISINSTRFKMSHHNKFILRYFFAYAKPKNTGYRQYPKQTKPRTIDPSYWNQLLPRIQSHAAKIVKMMLEPNTSQKQLARQLQSYFEFRNMTFTKNVRSDLGCLAVLVAMKQHHNSANFQEYENRIVDFVTLADITYNPFDNLMLKHLLFAIHKRIGMNLQKNIRQYYRMKMVEIAINNFQQIQNRDIIQLISIIEDSLEKDRTNFITKWRFYPLLQKIQHRISNLMKQYTKTKDQNILSSIDNIITPFFLYKYLHLIYFYDYMTVENAVVFYDFITKKNQLKGEDYKNVSGFMNSICYIPFVEIPNPIDPQGKLITIRKKLLEYFEQKYNNSSFYRRAWSQFHPQAKKYTMQRFFQDQFHSTFKSLPFQNIKDKYITLKKQDLIKPQISEFVWRLFKQNQKMILEKYMLNDIIRNLYPQKISLPKNSIPNINVRTHFGAAPDNQSNMKIWQALDMLGFTYKKEQTLSQRNVDLLIDQNIIIQVDGEGHYLYLTNQPATDTTFRNLHLLLSGYKLVIISMYEYNNNRSVQQLKELIREKMELIQQEDVIYVC